MSSLEKVYFHSEHTDCYTYFKIVGDFDPDTATELLGIAPEKFWRIGDKRKNGTVYDFALWQTGTCREYDIEVSDQMLKTLAPLLDKIDVLNEIKERYDVDFVLEAVPTVRFDESTPCLAPSLEVMRFCCATETSIDIDLYVSCPDEFNGGEVLEITVKENG
ncbi:MAG: DUF4279 domain-containing protein [Oscillospiraceae bacterium]|nr:DUF4279 domain-containing protein [Oscillospiraceae bacterium]